MMVGNSCSSRLLRRMRQSYCEEVPREMLPDSLWMAMIASSTALVGWPVSTRERNLVLWADNEEVANRYQCQICLCRVSEGS